MLSAHVPAGVKHLLSGPMKPLFASSTAPSPLLHLLLVLLSVPIIVIIVDHGWIQTHTLNTSVVIASTSYITVLIMELLD